MVPLRLAVSDYAKTEVTGSSSDGTTYLNSDTPPQSFKERFTQSWARRSNASDGEDGTKGPVGLRLLRYSAEPLIDLIFVHGLKGGSTTTWRKGGDSRNFWPKLWLPMERGLWNANIHTFGYDSNWTNSKSGILNIHDFGQSLLEEMRNSPHLRGKTNGPIILIGHSMGGLVVKKAFILSKDVPEFSERIRCIFFLATPHRGSDFASILKNIMTVFGVLSPRQYIADLMTGSTSTQLINEDFGKFAHELSIFSFYETIRMSPGLIVDKHSAILGPGFRNERVQYINANHKDICKFDNPEDPGYLTLRNAMISATQDILKDVLRSREADSKEKMQALKSFLGVTDRPVEHHSRAEGSCQWIHKHEDFQDWRDPPEDLAQDEKPSDSIQPSIFWIYANPGTGKTFLAAHIIDELAQFGLECAYYFFHFGNNTSQSLADFLRSIAYQMAYSNATIREKLVALVEGGSTFDKDDARTIWNKVFQKGIFQESIHTPQYWVIDAIDECSKYQEFFTMLKGLRLGFPLRIFITSRKMSDMQKLHRSLETTATVVFREVVPRDVMSDIECYVHDRAANLPSAKITENDGLASILLRRANACFLWVRLVLDELETVYSNESILQVLEKIPEGMVPYYERTLRVMSENKREKHIAQGVLLWVVASLRSLTITELSEALELDIGSKLNSASSAVAGLCGQLISVDEQSGLVEPVHATVREFLLSDAAGDFFVSKAEANKRIALTCLKLLSSPDMQPPRNRRQLARRPPRTTSPLLYYAATHFSEHIYASSTKDDEVLLALTHFLNINILSWIELIAQGGDLYPLIRVSKNLKSYLVRRAKYRSPLSGQVRDIESWATDLSRVATKFGQALLQSPASIYYLIPPLCPTSSAMKRQVAKRPDGLAVVGHLKPVWDDCIAAVTFGDGDAAATVSCGERLIAVGMESGGISLYDVRSCQKEGILQQTHPIDLIHFTDDLMIISTIRTLAALDLDGTVKWQIRIRFRCILLTSTNSAVVAVSQHGHVLKWDIKTGALQEDKAFDYRSPENDIDHVPSANAPGSASLSPDMELLALGYRWGTVCLWEVQTDDLINSVRDADTNSSPVLFFNPNPSIDLLLVVYKQRELVLYETSNGDLVKRQRTSGIASIISVTCSPDGRTLATIDTHGTLQIWDFEPLNLLYQVATPATSFRTLQFSSDGSSVIDMVDSSMRIWTPAILVRRNVEEDQSVSDDAPDLAAIEGGYEATRTTRVTALCAHPSLPVIFVGKPRGQIVAFDSRTGAEIGVLYSHAPDALVRQIIVSKANVLASRDDNGVIQVWQLASTANSKIHKGSPILEIHSTSHVRQFCFSSEANYLLVATSQSDTVYSIKNKSKVGALEFKPYDRSVWRWLTLPTLDVKKGEQFALLDGHNLRRFSATGFPLPVDTNKVEIDYPDEGELQKADIAEVLMSSESKALVISLHYMSGFVPSSTTFLFSLEGTAASETALKNLNDEFTKCCKHLIGFVESSQSLLFLNRDSWLCSVDIRSLAKGQWTRHFLVPSEFLSAAHHIKPVRTSDDSVAFCPAGGVTVVRNGLNFRETKEFESV